MRGRLFGLCVSGFGVLYLLPAAQLPLQMLGGPGPGLFPVIVSAGLILSGIGAAWGGEPPINAGPKITKGLVRVAIIFAAVIGFCFLLPRTGYLISGFLLMSAVLASFRVRWSLSVGIALASVIVTFVLFSSVLGLQLPSGDWIPWRIASL